MFVADIGNTDIVFGIFENKNLVHSFRIPSKKEESQVFFEYRLRNFFLENSINPSRFKKVVLSSVVPELSDLVRRVLERITGLNAIFVKSDIHPNVKVKIDEPEQLGTDLYCNAVAAYTDAQSCCIIVDFGTALTFTAVNQKGEILGVAITPGLNTAVHSLFSKTAQLPEVPLEIPKNAIGTNTIASIQSGVLYGYEGLVKGLLDKFQGELKLPSKVYATGGLSSIIPDLAKEFDEIDINLTLKGLRIIGEAF